MIAQHQYNALQGSIFTGEQHAIFAVLDGAQIDNLPGQVASLESLCLFIQPLDPMLEAAAPQLVKLSPGCPGTELALHQGWNSHWGVVLVTEPDIDLKALRRHLRQNLRVSGPDGRPLFFRFFDPRAFRTVVPSMDAEQRRKFFGPIVSCWVEGRNPDEILHFRRDGSEPQVLPLPGSA